MKILSILIALAVMTLPFSNASELNPPASIGVEYQGGSFDYRLTWCPSATALDGHWVQYWRADLPVAQHAWVSHPLTHFDLKLRAGTWGFRVYSVDYPYTSTASPIFYWIAEVPSISQLEGEWDGPFAGWFIDWTPPKYAEVDRYEVFTEDAYPAFDYWGSAPGDATGVQVFRQGEPVFDDGWLRIQVVTPYGDRSRPADIFLSSFTR